MVKAGLNSALNDTARSHLVTQPQLFLSVFQGVEETRAAVPQGLHLSGLVLKCLAGLDHSFQLVLGGQTDTDSIKYVTAV